VNWEESSKDRRNRDLNLDGLPQRLKRVGAGAWIAALKALRHPKAGCAIPWYPPFEMREGWATRREIAAAPCTMCPSRNDLHRVLGTTVK
jgi:hypothetical protein